MIDPAKKTEKKIVIKKKNEWKSDDTSSAEDAPMTNSSSGTQVQASAPTFPPRSRIVADTENFQKLFEESLQEQQIESRKIVKGKIVSIFNEMVFIDIGFKSEGTVPLMEFREHPKVGDETEVFVESTENDDGEIKLSKRKADQIIIRQQLDEAFEKKITVKGKVMREIKGGFIVDIGMDAFLPLSQADLYKVSDTKKYLNKIFEFRIVNLDKTSQNTNVVLTRRAILEEEQKKRKEEFFTTYQKDGYIMGTVKNIMDYGVFVDLGPIDGFVHIKDLAWDHIRHPKEKVQVGDEIKAIILNIDEENERISLGIKQLMEDPWVTFAREYTVDQIIEGTVTNITDYGAFVRVFEAVEGLIHIDELSWTKKIKHPKEVIHKGEAVQVKILQIDLENRRLSLGLKQVIPNPYEDFDQRVHEGSIVRNAPITKVLKNGLIVEIEKESGIEGFLPISEIDWIKKNIDIAKHYKVDQTIDVMVLEMDMEEKKILLGRKQLIDNPFADFEKSHPIGSVVKGKIVRLTDFGAFVSLGNGIEGLIHISHLSHQRVEKVNEVVEVGNDVNCVVLDVDINNNKVSLSLKHYQRRLEEQEIEQYMKEDDSSSFSLGDMLDLSKLKKGDNRKDG